LAIAGMLVIWKPWAGAQTSDRTISVTGDATLKAVPDEYIFSPSYDFTNASQQTALSQLTVQSNTIISKLKSLGVSNDQISTNSTGGDSYYNFVTNDDNTVTYTLQLTITVDNSSLAQKIQNYLVSTSPTGSVSPDVNFSNAQQANLDNQARNIATKDARAKAEQTATNLGFKLGAVKSVADESGFNNPTPLLYSGNIASGAASATPQPSLSVQPGQNELDYSIDVVYYIH